MGRYYPIRRNVWKRKLDPLIRYFLKLGGHMVQSKSDKIAPMPTDALILSKQVRSSARVELVAPHGYRLIFDDFGEHVGVETEDGIELPPEIRSLNVIDPDSLRLTPEAQAAIRRVKEVLPYVLLGGECNHASYRPRSSGLIITATDEILGNTQVMLNIENQALEELSQLCLANEFVLSYHSLYNLLRDSGIEPRPGMQLTCVMRDGQVQFQSDQCPTPQQTGMLLRQLHHLRRPASKVSMLVIRDELLRPFLTPHTVSEEAVSLPVGSASLLRVQRPMPGGLISNEWWIVHTAPVPIGSPIWLGFALMHPFCGDANQARTTILDAAEDWEINGSIPVTRSPT